jgi:hypothetical protein
MLIWSLLPASADQAVALAQWSARLFNRSFAVGLSICKHNYRQRAASEFHTVTGMATDTDTRAETAVVN